jgi:hypothetical protein
MLQAKERLWPSYSQQISLPGVPAGRSRPSRMTGSKMVPRLQAANVENNYFGAGVNRFFLSWFVSICTVYELYLQTGIQSPVWQRDESKLKK